MTGGFTDVTNRGDRIVPIFLLWKCNMSTCSGPIKRHTVTELPFAFLKAIVSFTQLYLNNKEVYQMVLLQVGPLYVTEI